jgi:hypothetical protein
MTTQVQRVHHILCKLVSALKETTEGLAIFNALQPTPRIADSLLEQVKALELSTQALYVQMKCIYDSVNSSSFPILLEGRYLVFFLSCQISFF